MSRDRAEAIALARTSGGNVDEVENEFEHGRAAWKVRVVKDGIRYDVYLDKATGAIFRFENEGRH
ncbi:MAG TPA: PepSY domain-containing protein [Candidatus Limnocylindrales bacterium]